MTTLLNEEIMAIKCTMAHLKKGMNLELDSGKRHKMQQDYNELQDILKDKLSECNDYHV